MAVHVGKVTIPATSAVGIFASSGVLPDTYTINISAEVYESSVSLVDSGSATSAGYALPSAYTLVTDGSEVYVYNYAGSSVSFHVLFTPVLEAQGPTSSATTYTY